MKGGVNALMSEVKPNRRSEKIKSWKRLLQCETDSVELCSIFQ